MVSPVKLAFATFCAPAIHQHTHELGSIRKLNTIAPDTAPAARTSITQNPMSANQNRAQIITRHLAQRDGTEPDSNEEIKFLKFTSFSKVQQKNSPLPNELNSTQPEIVSEKNNTNFAIPGIEIGIPLNIIAGFFNTLRYGKLEFGPEDAILQACLGYVTYGTDRLLDALTETDEPSEKKQALYQSIKDNLAPVIATIAASSGFAYHTLAENEQTRPFIPLLGSTFFYKNLKENCGPIKPFYIATMWTAACVILPAVMHDHNFSILQKPEDYVPAALLMFGATNLADAADIEEDMKKNIDTLAVKLGEKNANIISALALLSAGAIIGNKLLEHLT